MGRLIEPGKHIDKTTARIMDLLNVYDVRKDGLSMVDNDGIVDMSVLTQLQDEIDLIVQVLDLSLYYGDESDNTYVDENGDRYTWL